MRLLPESKLGFYTSLVSGSFGCLVLYGWKAELHALVQVIPGAAPMQFNTALGFILVSAFLALLWMNRKAWLFVPSGLLALLGVVRTLQKYWIEIVELPG